MNISRWASDTHAKLWANFLKHGYPEKVSINAEQLAELFVAQGGKCYYTGVPLTYAAQLQRVKKGPINKHTIVIVEASNE